MERKQSVMRVVLKKSVSIPFKREGTWKGEEKEPGGDRTKVSIPFKREGTWKDIYIQQVYRAVSFNSLQAGRHMESTLLDLSTDEEERVSIPFKREGAWKAAE